MVSQNQRNLGFWMNLRWSFTGFTLRPATDMKKTTNAEFQRCLAIGTVEIVIGTVCKLFICSVGAVLLRLSSKSSRKLTWTPCIQAPALPAIALQCQAHLPAKFQRVAVQILLRHEKNIKQRRTTHLYKGMYICTSWQSQPRWISRAQQRIGPHGFAPEIEIFTFRYFGQLILI